MFISNAKKVVFVENYNGVLPILKKKFKNLKSLKIIMKFLKKIYINDIFLKL
jgi:hypothetical protein